MSWSIDPRVHVDHLDGSTEAGLRLVEEPCDGRRVRDVGDARERAAAAVGDGAAVSAAVAPSMSPTRTAAPASARASALARPIPLPAPVTIARVPASRPAAAGALLRRRSR